MKESADKHTYAQRGRRIARLVLPVLLALPMLLLTSGTPAFAGLGGELAPSFPQIDVQTGKQESRASVLDRNGDLVVTGYRNLTGGTNDDYYTVKFKGDGSGVAWRASYDKAGGSDVAMAVAVDGSNNVIVTGYAWNGVNNDIHTIKYDGSTGALLWQQTFNGAANGNDAATSVAVDADGNVYVAGYSQNASGNDDFLVLKYAPEGGAPVWQEIYNGPANGIDRINSIAVGTGGFAVTGYSSNGTKFDILTRKYGFDKSLIREWRYSTPGTTNPDTGVFVKLDAAGDVVMTGYISNATDFDIYTAKYSVATGGILWQRTYNGGFEDEPKGLWIDAAGDVYLTGYTWTLAGRYEFYTARYNGSTGSVAWQNIYNSGGNNDDVTVPSGIVVDETSGAVYVTGYTYKSTEGNYDIQLVKYNRSNGSQLWQTMFDGAARLDDEPVGIGLNAQGDVLVAGWTKSASDSDFLALKFDRGELFAPTGLTAQAASDTSVALSWVDNSADETGFVVERKLGENGIWGEVATLAANTLNWIDTGLTPNNYYYYRVRAVKGGSVYSHYTNDASVLTKVVAYVPPVWTYVFNGDDNREDYAEAIAVGPDDNPVVTGRSDLREDGVDPPAFSFDFKTMKLNRSDTPTTQNPRVLWSAVYDSGDGGLDGAKAVAVNSLNEVFVTGNAYLYWPGATDNTNDVFTIKYPAAGPPESWHHQYNGPAGGDDRSTSIATAVDGSNNIAVVGYGVNASNNADIYVMKLSSAPTVDANGNAVALWTAIPFNGGGDDFPNAVAFDPSGNVFVAGYTKAGTYYSWYVAKYDGTNGSRVWTDIYGLGFGNNVAKSIAVDSHGNAFVTGYMTDATGKKQMYTIKYDGSTSPATRRIWERTGPGGGDDEGKAVKVDPIDGAVVVAGTVLVSTDNHDFHLIRYGAADGLVVWERNFERPSNDDVLSAMAMDSSGYLYLAGNTGNGATTDIMSVVYDYAGTFLNAVIYNGAANDFDEAKDVTVNYQGEAFVAGYTTNSSGNADVVVLKQKNDYILVPAPFTATANADSTKMNLAWRANTPGTGFHLWRTVGAVSQYSTWTQLPDVAAGNTSYVDSGLNPNTYYCYQIDAFSGSLNSRKIIACGTTTLPPPALAVPTADSTTQITLSWPNVAGNTGYRIERKVGTGAWAELAVTAANTVTYPDTGLTAGSQYTYRVSTRNVGGTSLPSAEQVVYTNPVAPVVNAPTLITTNRIDFAWNNVTGNTGYRVERKTGTGGTWGEIGTTATNTVSYSDTGLTENTQYSYRVRAYNASGTSQYSNTITVMTQLPAPTLSSATAVATNQVNLSWTAVPGATGYIIKEASCAYSDSTPSNCTTYEWAWNGYYQSATTGAVTTYQRTGLSAGYAYRFTVTATATGTSSAASNSQTAWMWFAAPTLTVTPASETSLALSWNNIIGETNYTVERRLSTDTVWAAITAGTNLAANTVVFTDTGLSLQTSYCYRIHPVSTVPGGPPSDVYSNEACLTTPLPAPVVNALAVPSSTAINVTWSNVTGNTGYQVERCSLNYPDNPEYVVSYSNADWIWTCAILSPSLPQDQNYYNDSGLTAGYTYRYRVRDTYLGGTSAWSTMQYATTIPPATSFTSSSSASTSQIILNWTNIYGETSYKLDWKEGAEGTWTTIPLGQNSYTYTHTGLKTGTVYYYRIRGANASGDAPNSAEISRPTLLAAPVLNAPTGITTSKVDLSWGNMAGNTGYKIQRKTGAAGAWGQVGTSTTDVAAYSDTTVAAGTLYYYRVVASNAGGDSAPSNEVSLTTTPAKPVLSLAAVTTDRIDLTWPEVLGATNYKISRKTGTGGTYAEIVNKALAYSETYCGYSRATVACPTPSPAQGTYSNTGLDGNTSYCYQIIAWNSTGGDSAASDEKCLESAPMPSANLTAAAQNGLKVKLDWTPGTCAQGACESPDGYEVERQVWSGRFAFIGTVAGTGNSFIDTVGVNPNTSYTYRVRPYHAVTSSFDSGINGIWIQRGLVRSSTNTIVQDVTTPPINIVDGVNGNSRISGEGGAVVFTTSSTGGGQANSYNFTRLNLASPGAISNDFEMSVDYLLPNGQVTTTQYHVYGRLQVNFTNTSGGTDSLYVERYTAGGNYYNAVFTINGVNRTGTIPTADVSGKLRITRNNGAITASVWTNGAWSPLLSQSYPSTAPATFAGVTQYAQRNEAVNLKITFDNFSAVTDRAAYSNAASVKTPPYGADATTCP